jgi:UPF0716 protein FxsA
MRISWAKWLLLGALSLPIVEIVVFVAVATQIGFVNAFVIQLACSLAGIMVIRSAGRVRLGHLRSQLDEGTIRTTQFEGTDLVRLTAGVLLVVPGFLTDVLGGLLLLPGARRGLGAMLRGAAARSGGGARGDRVIDLEPGEWRRQDSGVRGQEPGRKPDPLLPDA